jgi:uncharacterized protein (TIGR02449 family)
LHLTALQGKINAFINSNKVFIMDDLFNHLEKRLQQFLQKYTHIKRANSQLQTSKTQIARDKEQLLIKHKSAVIQIEGMVTRLKSIEGLP